MSTSVAASGRTLNYRLVQLLIAFLISITPLSYVGCCLLLYYRPWQFLTGVPRALTLVLFLVTSLECLWLPYHWLTVQRLRARLPRQHRATTVEERERLVRLSISALESTNDVKGTLEGWFFGRKVEDTPRPNAEMWAAWAFYDAALDELTPDELAECKSYITFVESRMGAKYKDSPFDPAISCIRLTIDQMQVLHRPLVYYAGTGLIHLVGLACLRILGFRQASTIVPSGDPKKAGTHRQGYFYRPGTSHPENTVPVVLIHGIGIGFLHYLGLIAGLPREVDVFLLDWPHVSMRLTETIPTVQETVESIKSILMAAGHKKACFVGHSLGSAALSWTTHLHKELIHSTVALDPITYLLVQPAVAYNFLHRTPTTTLELLMHYFVTRELYIAHTIRKHFSWSHNALFVQDLPKGKHAVVLSSHDQIVDSASVRRYLQKEGGVDVYWIENTTHGAMMLRAEPLKLVRGIIRDAAGLQDKTL
ncbi:Alpha/Beta hydrolase protein [Gaertneriomyces semiglobifer]|nr:Alpha/Beta hydrolase protein [Gaertneriomyces semiglobifer]